MEDLVDLIATDASASDISDKIKESADLFGGEVPEAETEAPEAESELEVEDETTIETEET